jgi:CRISPR-associated protein Cas5d
MPRSLYLKIRGDRACFTEAFQNVDRNSSDFPGPSACEGILKAIYWKPEMAYEVEALQIVKLGRRRHEVFSGVRSFKRGAGHKRLRRTYVTNVEYIIKFSIALQVPESDQNNLTKHYSIFIRRAKKGQSFTIPYLGQKEYIADFDLVDDFADDAVFKNKSRSYGRILHHKNYRNNTSKRICEVTDTVWFNAEMRNSIIDFNEGIIV